jgi:hypothetical protein
MDPLVCGTLDAGIAGGASGGGFTPTRLATRSFALEWNRVRVTGEHVLFVRDKSLRQ